jgi:hypothetical protein
LGGIGGLVVYCLLGLSVLGPFEVVWKRWIGEPVVALVCWLSKALEEIAVRVCSR